MNFAKEVPESSQFHQYYFFIWQLYIKLMDSLTSPDFVTARFNTEEAIIVGSLGQVLQVKSIGKGVK